MLNVAADHARKMPNSERYNYDIHKSPMFAAYAELSKVFPNTLS